MPGGTGAPLAEFERIAGRFPVFLIAHEGRDYVVNLADESAWARKLRAAGGAAVLRHGDTCRMQLTAVTEAESAPILSAFLRRRALTRSAAWAARYYFGLPPHRSAQQLAQLAARCPVFEIHETTAGPQA